MEYALLFQNSTRVVFSRFKGPKGKTLTCDLLFVFLWEEQKKKKERAAKLLCIPLTYYILPTTTPPSIQTKCPTRETGASSKATPVQKHWHVKSTSQEKSGNVSQTKRACILVIGVFTGLIKGIGVSGIQVEEIYSIDKETLEDLKYGLQSCLLYT